MTPKIKSACVRCKRKNEKDFMYVEGMNHSCCYDYLRFAYEMYPQAQPDKYDFEEGFLLTNGDFVNRMTAMQIATETDQLKPEYKNLNYPLLYSYMVYYKRI